MKIFILGAGYVGKAILKNQNVSGHYYTPSTTREENCDFLKAYTEDVIVIKSVERERLKIILDSFDGMLVCVAPIGQCSYEIYVQTAEAISYALKDRLKPFYLLYTSSTLVYRGETGPFVNEEMKLKPIDLKAKNLVDAENIYLKCLNPLISVCVLRLGGIYGPERELLKRAKQISGKELAGSGDEPTNHSYLYDIVNCIEFCIERNLRGIYNCVNDEHPTRKELYSKLCEILDLPLPLWNKERKAEHGCECMVSNKKICSLGFSPHILMLNN